MIEAQHLDAPELAALLHFYADAGVEWLVEDEPVDSFAAFEATRNRAPSSTAAPASASDAPSRTAPSRQAPSQAKSSASRAAPAPQPAAPVAVPNEQAVAEAREVAARARSLDELKEALGNFSGCNLKLSALSTIFASGSLASGLMIVGPMPEPDDEREGVAFSGPPGFLLERMIGAIGLKRDDVLTTMLIPWRTPGNRPPLTHEVDMCRPFIDRQIELAAPKVLLLLGNLTARTFLGANGNIHQLRGKWHSLSFGDKTVATLASLAPSEILKAPRAKAQAWSDLLSLQQNLKG